jgi:iron-sulfur cluster assembly accessory protein
MSIALTPNALRELKSVIASQREKDQAGAGGDAAEKPCYVRVGVIGGGCSGFTYDMTLTDRAGDHDEHFVQDGVEIICDPKSHIYLNGTTIDFVDGLMERGFRFDNPNATTHCGCGASFGV